jgi:1-acyl-sn-glycerol-3-phosphate acyltransferase
VRPRTPVLDVFRPAVHALSRAYFGLRLQGTEHIPGDGPLVIVPNHQTYADPPLVTIPVRRPVYYMAWSRLFEIPVFSSFIRLLRAFPVDIDARDSRATREAVRLLQRGAALMIFPEGERTADGRLQRFKPGAFRLAVSLDVPILPVTIVGGNDSWPPGRLLPRRGRITITYHPPLRAVSTLGSRIAARDLADRTRAAILSAMPGRPTEALAPGWTGTLDRAARPAADQEPPSSTE